MQPRIDRKETGNNERRWDCKAILKTEQDEICKSIRKRKNVDLQTNDWLRIVIYLMKADLSV